MKRGPQKYITYELVYAVVNISKGCNVLVSQGSGRVFDAFEKLSYMHW